jgi:hypothetical protein
MQSGRLAQLMARKAQLDSAVNQERNSASADHLKLSALKRQKLMVKEEISRMSS